jgi:hypothetical protein
VYLAGPPVGLPARTCSRFRYIGTTEKKGIKSRYRTSQETGYCNGGFCERRYVPNLRLTCNSWPSDCLHNYLRTYFRPATDLDTYNSLNPELHKPVESGWRSKAAQRELSWTVLDLKRLPSSDRCCSRCTPNILSRYPPSDRHDARLKAFASDFLFTIPSFSRSHRQRTDSVSSVGSTSPPSPTRAAFLPFMYKVPVPKEQRDDLVAALDVWRTTKQAQ